MIKNQANHTSIEQQDNKDQYRFRREYFGGVLYDLREYEYLFCDDKVTELLLSNRPAEIQNIVPDGLRERARTLMRPDETPNYNILPTQSVDDWLSAPLQVYYDISTFCNLQCPHCYTSSGQRSPGELTFDEIVTWSHELSQNGVFKISLGGGEPLLHPQFEAIIRAFRRLDISVSLSTHGLLFKNSRWAQVFNELNMRTITVSVEGGRKESYEAIRGKGNWDRFINSMLQFKEDYRGRYAMRVTITKQTLGEVRDLLMLGHRIGAYAVKFKFMQLIGRAKENRELFPTASENTDVVKEALALSKEIGIKVTVPQMFSIGTTQTSVNRYLPMTTDGQMPYEPTFGCGGGRVGVYVFPNGGYSACVSMGPAYASCNIRTHSLREAWLHGSGFKRMRAIQGKEPCLSCNHLEQCRGGCRARALAVYGDPDAIDPYCPLISSTEKPSPETDLTKQIANVDFIDLQSG